ncbi:hypothetical protein VHEMI08220 [[Torrubiella] hemipterigena]|uniref:SAC domain-containing protein n=1 Tax=[Torrubiella] hemipterigena TaxID=1531966 RepID=A0A0A1T5Y4_9HYPO|nr:hypothetical protein VHEMI08220 [[Torrubiella] hemipterigena]
MAGLARKIVVCAAIDGLIIQPLTSRGQRPFSPVQIRYGDSVISDVSRDHIPNISQDDDSFEAFGVIGLVTVSKISFLITITRRHQVAQIFGHPIYAVTGVAITPCSSKDRATKSIRKTSRQLESQPPSSDGEQTESSDDEVEIHGLPDEVDDAVVDVPSPERSARNSIAEDVFRRRGSYGKFAQRWFSRDAWSTGKKSAMGIPEASAAPLTDTTSVVDTRKIPEANEVATTSLLPKLIHAMYVLFGSSKSFYYSYDIDITRSIMGTPLKDNVEKPLYTAVEEDFFWNRSVLAPFIEARQEALALPIMQGFVGQKSFTVDSSPPQVDEPAVESMEMRTLSPARDPETEKTTPDASKRRESERTYLLTLISRRSTQRPGLRYMRRGINENGYTANTVETEQILSGENWESKRPIQSFVQMRGSIPLFWSQTPYALKPIPVVQHSPEQNYRACKMHFQRIIDRYGQIQVVNLVEKHGIEAPLGNLFEQNVETLTKELGDSELSFEWFDFHHACRGMKFENVSDLLLRVKDRLETLGSTVQADGKASHTQSGVFRTNCMDCLDRTNVCQSSFAKHMLEYQLKEDGIDMSAQIDQQTMWFNELWADNGDAVSNQYASTAAMKGDYTRTRKRDYRGALNDLGLSLTRLYNGSVLLYSSVM